MVNPIPASVRKVWDKWNTRGVILFSLSLQAFLVLAAPYRKVTARKVVILLIWSGYLLADWAANFAVGLISNSQSNQSGPSNSTSISQSGSSNSTLNSQSGSSNSTSNSDLLAFWAPFLLLHLGGPDTITAFALEDNELWLRHLLGLIFQATAALYVFAQSLPDNKLWIATLLMFVAGVIKYAERTRALYLASLETFRDSMLKEPDPGPNYAKLMEEYASKREAKLPTKIIMIPEPAKESKDTDITMKRGGLNNLEVVQYAYHFFKIFKGLVVDMIFSFRERKESQDFFDKRKPVDALRVIEVELNFIYEVLYTKVQVVHSILGYIFRFIASGAVLVALWLFHFKTKKHDFNQFDVGITYTLLLGAIVLDIIAVLMLIFSDWTLTALGNPDSDSVAGKNSFPMKVKLCAVAIFSKFLNLKNPFWYPVESKRRPDVKHKALITPILFRRWSGSVSTHNLIRYCLKGRPSRIYNYTSFSGIAVRKIFQWLHMDQIFQGITDIARKIIDPVSHCLSLDSVGRFLGCISSAVSKCLTFIKDNLVKLYKSVASKAKFYMEKHKVIYWLGFIIQKEIQLIGKIIDFFVYIICKIRQSFKFIANYIIDHLGVMDFLDEIRYVSREPFTEQLWKFIFYELRNKSRYADDPETAKRISSARGDWVLTDSDSNSDRTPLMTYVTDVQYDESLLLWHIATELCYNTDPDNAEADTDTENREAVNENNDEDKFERNDFREFSKLLSDYMLYLLVMQPTMMSSVAGIGKIRFRDTCAEAKRFFIRRRIKPDQQKEACDQILSINTAVKPVEVKGDRSKSVLFDASILAQELKKWEKEKKEDKWKLISKVWVELMSYAASHCRADTHAQQVSKGGELITFVWLLMAHFGLGEQFQINEGHARAKLIVGK